MSVNKVILVGNLGADPEARGAVTKLRLATAERRKQGDSWVDHTEWHSVACFGKTAENVAKFCKKGQADLRRGQNPHQQVSGPKRKRQVQH
jgi:single-strand DNA-binding protein